MFPVGYFPGGTSGSSGSGGLLPADPMNAAIAALRILLSNVPFFQTWTNTASEDDAADRIFLGEMGFPIKEINIHSGVAIVTTREPHDIIVGNKTTISGASVGDESVINIDGTYTVTAITEFTLSFATSIGDQDTAKPDGAFLIKGSRPLAVLSESDNSLSTDTVASDGYSIYRGSIDVLLEADTSDDYSNDPVNSLFEAREAYSSIIQGLAANQGTLDFMCINKIDSSNPPEFASYSEARTITKRFARWRAVFKVSWGLDS